MRLIRKELNMLLSNCLQVLLFTFFFVLALVITHSVVAEKLLADLDYESKSALNGPFDLELVREIKNEHGEYFVQKERQTGTFDAEAEAEVILKRTYAEVYEDDAAFLEGVINSSSSPEASAKAQEILNHFSFYYSSGWQGYFREYGDGYSSVPLWIAIIASVIALGSNLLCAEYTLGSWILVGTTPKGKTGIIIRKFLALSLFGVGILILLHFTAILTLRASGELSLIGKRVSEVFHIVPLWDPTLLGGILFNLFFSILAILIAISVVLLISALLKNALLTMVANVLVLLITPRILNGVLGLRPLCFPQNVIGIFSVTLQSGFGSNALTSFFNRRPFLGNSPALTVVYISFISLSIVVINLSLTRKFVREWYR